jgi:hypothetical protein
MAARQGSPVGSNPVARWDNAMKSLYPTSQTARKKSCLRGAFLGALKGLLSVLNNEQVKNALSPVTKQVGQDIVELYRRATGDNFEMIWAKLAKKRAGKVAPTAEGFRRIVPLLQSASVQFNEILQDRWANLMDSTIDEIDGYMPSFGRPLSEMSAEEAQYLDTL